MPGSATNTAARETDTFIVKKRIWSSPGGSASRMAVLCLMQQRPDPRPVQPETDHGERAKRDQDFHPTSTEPPSRRHLRLLHPAHHIEHQAGTQDQPCPGVCRVRVRPQQSGFFRCRAFWYRAHRQVEQPIIWQCRLCPCLVFPEV